MPSTEPYTTPTAGGANATENNPNTAKAKKTSEAKKNRKPGKAAKSAQDGSDLNKKKSGDSLSIRSRSKLGFRRCGRRFFPEAQIVELGSLKKGEEKILRSEKNLIVKDVDSKALDA